MRASVHALSVLAVVSLCGCVGSARHEAFTATGPESFLYSARTNTVMTENDDGAAERLRRRWLTDALQVHGMCGDGYVVDVRSFVPNVAGPFGNGGEIVYKGRCMSGVLPPLPPPAPVVVEQRREKKTIVKETVPES
ncbi:MAG TPA: hypothetical protein VHU15_02320 [Stellaceae bacterium]|nr:hypothetical protein [Stellaceae bacterium]